MDKEKLIKLLKQFLKNAEQKRNNFKGNLSNEERQDIAIDFQTKIIEILDYVYTNFPVNKNQRKDFLPST